MPNFDEAYKKYDELTYNFFENKTMKEIKEKSQYFTPYQEVDKILSDLIIIENDVIKILDPACGNGILILKLLDKILLEYEPNEIIIYAYDTDSKTLTNFEDIFNTIDFNDINTYIDIKFLNLDFLKTKIDLTFDYIIMNPPYKKLNVSNVPIELNDFLNGQPNSYHLFIAKTLTLLGENGILSIISPKNYLSGKYTENLRKFIFENYSIYKIHTFNNRRSIFSHKIIQEICIVHIRSHHHENILMSYNGNEQLELPIVNLRINNNTNIIQTPRDIYDYRLLKKFEKLPIGTIGTHILMKTGKVVQFRVVNKSKVLKSKPFQKYQSAYPLIVYRHINSEKFNYIPLTRKSNNTAITILNEGSNNNLLIKNRNYVLIRKNTDKKYNKLIHSIPYLKNLDSEKLGFDNGLAYLTNEDDSLSKVEILGINCILMSKQFDDYYRMINSSHTLNIYEFKNMHFPDLDTVRNIGKMVENEKISIDVATEIFERYL